MKKHINAIITKFLFVAPVMGLLGPILSGMSYPVALSIAAIITLGAYLSADLVLLPRMGNRVALAGDALIAAIVYWEMTAITGWAKFNLPTLVLLTILIVFGEIYFHNYLNRTLLRPQPGHNKNANQKSTVNEIKNRYQIYKKSRRGKYK